MTRTVICKSCNCVSTHTRASYREDFLKHEGQESDVNLSNAMMPQVTVLNLKFVVLQPLAKYLSIKINSLILTHLYPFNENNITCPSLTVNTLLKTPVILSKKGPMQR